MRTSVSYRKKLIEELKRDPEEAAGYLTAALEGGNREVFLLALKDVIDARGGMSQLARKTKLDRASLYRMFSARGNPEVRSLERVLEAMGLQLAVVRSKGTGQRAA